MSRRVLSILLVVSLVFNFAVLIGFVRSRTSGPSAQGPTTAPAERSMLTRLASELRLDEAQAGALADLQRRQQQQTSVFGDSMLVLRQDLQNELRKQEPDLERVRTLVDQEADVQRQRRLAEAELYGEFVGLLSPQQRQQLSQRVAAPPSPPPPGSGQQRQRGPNSPPPPDVVRRFDRNGNGRLEPEEAKAARLDLQNRRREVAPHVPQRPALWPWFDADDDGELSDAERAEMEAFMREHHAPPPAAQPMPPQGPDRRGGPDGREPRRGARPPDAGGNAPPPPDGALPI